MVTTHTALRKLYDELGGPAALWLGYSDLHHWVILDRTLEPNRPENKTSQLYFELLSDFSEVEILRSEWDAMSGLTPYGRKIIDPSELHHLLERLNVWRETRAERRFQHRERQLHKQRECLAASQAKDEEDRYQRIRAIPYSRRARADTLFVMRRDLIEQQSAERDAIDAIIHERSIQFLIHFTSVENLKSILTKGLLPRHTLELKGIQFDYNDDTRMDGLKEATSLSIDFPNYLMLYKQQKKAQGTAFCLLALSPRILTELPCLFYPKNAAKQRFIQYEKDYEQHTGVKALERMFLGSEEHQERNQLPPSYTTDPQAEVLVVDSISTAYIQGVVLPRTKDLQNKVALLELAESAGVSDLTETHRKWFLPRPDDAARLGASPFRIKY